VDAAATNLTEGQSDHGQSVIDCLKFPLVWKFGGTSVSDPARLRAVAERLVAAQRSGRGVVAVLSAMGKSTDELSRMAYQMTSRPPLRELDALLSVGESVSCALASMAVSELGSRAVSLTGAQAGIQLAEQVQARALRAGLILELGGREDCVVRMLPPLNVTTEVMDIALWILLPAIDDAYASDTAAA
jgi:hypothetical protein